MAWQVSKRVWDSSQGIIKNDKLLLLALSEKSDEYGVSWYRYDTLADMIEVTRRSVMRIVSNLRESGHVYVLEQGGQSGGRGYTNVYCVVSGLSFAEIVDILTAHPRLKLSQDEAKVAANTLIANQKGVRDVTQNPEKGDASVLQMPIKGDASDTLNGNQKGDTGGKKGDTGGKKGDTGGKKGDIAVSPEPLISYHEPINNHHFASPIGDAEASGNPEKIPKSKKPLSSTQKVSQDMFGALVEICQYDLGVITKKERGQLNQAEKKMRDNGYSPSDIQAFEEWWYENDWRGRKEQPPRLSNIRETWGQFINYQKGRTNGTYQSNSHTTYSSDKPPPGFQSEIWAKIVGTDKTGTG